jgi:hypothetical protein
MNISADQYSYNGEFPGVPERLLVAPARGKLHRGAICEGERVRRGAELGSLTGPEGLVALLIAPVAGIFDSWMALEGQTVERGTPVFAIRRRIRRR